MDFQMDYESPLGLLTLTCREEGLTGIRMNCGACGGSLPHPILTRTAQWLDGYFAGAPEAVSIPLAPQGTPFQHLIWELLLTIPYGESRTYGSLARQAAGALGRPRMSAQAVGGAVGRNPISILIPCHRVLGSGGQLTGYAGGLEKKQWLLRHEGIAFLP